MTISGNRLSNLLEQLWELLEEERRILLSGTPEQIIGVVGRKLALADIIEKEAAALAATAPTTETLSRLDRYNRENAVICSAMLRHMTRTIDRLRLHELHRSYGPDGVENTRPVQNPLGAA